MVTASGVSHTPSRLGWLDALRGGAALVVALHHASWVYLPSLRSWLADWFDPGVYGVLVFFLVSGYIIPASLERRGSVRGFWIGRLFRIYPLLLVGCALAVVPFMLGLLKLPAGLDEHSPATAVVAHLTMMQDLLDVPNAINVLWTLSYEMAFYLLIVALFVVGGHRRSASTASALTVVALIVVALAATGVLASAQTLTTLLSRTAGTGPVVLVTAAALVVAIGAAVSKHPTARTAGGLLGGLIALALVTLNGRIEAWQGLIMLALMFLGTVIHRAEHGQISGRRAAVTAGFVVTGGVVAVLWGKAPYGVPLQLIWTSAIVLSVATFALVWRFRGRGFPRWATGLGTISYSVYLLHPLLLRVANEHLDSTGRTDLLGLALFLAVLLLVSWAAYRWIEAPMQRLGRRITRPAQPTKKPEPKVLTTP